MSAQTHSDQPNSAQRAVLAMILAASKVRDGRWFEGAPSHVFGEFYGEIERLGWRLVLDLGADSYEYRVAYDEGRPELFDSEDDARRRYEWLAERLETAMIERRKVGEWEAME